MSYLSKAEYQRRAESAGGRMNENSENESLTEEQHEVLAFFCSIRHVVHCIDVDSLFNSESVDYDMWKYIDTQNYDNELIQKINEVKLPKWDWSYDSSDVDNDGTIIECYEEDERENARENAIEQISIAKERFNTSCEEYLRMIDKKYGTSYCPTGALRV